MPRLKAQCPGNCATCELLMSGEVQMVPCILDQMFQRQQRIESKLDQLIEQLNTKDITNLVSIDKIELDETVS